MAGEQDSEPVDRLAAQEGAGELARMGIDPQALGLDAFVPPTPPPDDTPPPAAPAVRPALDRPGPAYRGVASVPSPRAPGQPSSATPAPTSAMPAPTSAAATGGAPTSAAPAGLAPTSAAPAVTSPPAPTAGAAPPVQGAGPLAAATGPVSAIPVATAAVTAPTPGIEESTLSRPLAGPDRPPSRRPSAVNQSELLDRIADVPGMLLPAGWRRTVRAVTFGVLAPGAAAAVQHERHLVARARTRRPEPRVVAFIAGKGGVGTTTTAAGVALTLATLRNDSTALVCARSGTGSLGQRVLGEPAPAVGGVAVTGPDGPDQPAWPRDRLAVLDGSPWHTPTPRAQLVQLLEDLREQHPLTLVDIGNELSETAHGALGRADQIVLVTTASRDAVESTRVALSRVHQVDPFRLATVVVALTCLHRRQYRRTARRLREELGQGDTRIVPVPYDAALATGDRLDLARIRPATREAYLRIAGLAVAPGESQAWFAQPAGAGR